MQKTIFTNKWDAYIHLWVWINSRKLLDFTGQYDQKGGGWGAPEEKYS